MNASNNAFDAQPRDDGGPAFPVGSPAAEWSAERYTEDGARRDAHWTVRPEIGGMTLRDYFAAKAMHALMFDPVAGAENSIRLLADMSYDMADAMLKARQS